MIAQNHRFSAHVRAFSELLIRLRATLSNDLDLVLILAVIAERHYAGTVPPDTSGAHGINTLSIALYTEIPRETVRRKVGILVEKGWVDCDARGNLSPTGLAAAELSKGTAATLAYLNAVTKTDPSGVKPDEEDQRSPANSQNREQFR